MQYSNIKQGLIKAGIILVPTYITAYLTDKMIYVVPMLAACGFIAAALFNDKLENRVDDNESDMDSE
jgi:hypothetical protein